METRLLALTNPDQNTPEAVRKATLDRLLKSIYS